MSTTMTAYLMFEGQCAEAMRFYEKTMGGTLTMMTYGQSPMAGDMPAESHDRIMHAELRVGEASVMGADGPPGSGAAHHGFSVMMAVPEADEAERVFHALAEGGTVRMPMTETFWAHRFGMVVDKFGVPWGVNCLKPMP